MTKIYSNVRISYALRDLYSFNIMFKIQRWTGCLFTK
jgi:hypothetical protein